MIDDKQELLDTLHYMGNRSDLIRDNHGNLSIATNSGFWIKPSGMMYQDIKLDDICLVTSAGSYVSASNKKPSVDAKHHAAIYNINRLHVRAICHTHSTFVVAYAIANKDIACCCTEHADLFGDTIHCLPYADLDNWGEAVAKYFWKNPTAKAVIMGNHGCVTVGATPLEAVKNAIALENLAEKNYHATVLNNKTQPMDKDEVLKWHYRYKNSYGQ